MKIEWANVAAFFGVVLAFSAVMGWLDPPLYVSLIGGFGVGMVVYRVFPWWSR